MLLKTNFRCFYNYFRSYAHYIRSAFPSTTGSTFSFSATQSGTSGASAPVQQPSFGTNTFGKTTTAPTTGGLGGLQPAAPTTGFPSLTGTSTFGGMSAPATSFGTNLGTFGGMQSSMFNMGSQPPQGQQGNVHPSNVRQEEYRGQSRFVEYRSKYAPYLDLTRHEWDMPTDGIQVGELCNQFKKFRFDFTSVNMSCISFLLSNRRP